MLGWVEAQADRATERCPSGWPGPHFEYPHRSHYGVAAARRPARPHGELERCRPRRPLQQVRRFLAGGSRVAGVERTLGTDHDICKQEPPAGESLSLRPASELERARTIAQTWHWRSRTRGLIESGKPIPTLPNDFTLDQVVRITARSR